MSGTKLGIVWNHGDGCPEDPMNGVAGNADHRPNGIPELSAKIGTMIRRDKPVQDGQVDVATTSQYNDPRRDHS